MNQPFEEKDLSPWFKALREQEINHPQPPLAQEADRLGRAHAPSASSRRAMIRRMISLVPSRMRCTRQSRR